MISKAIETIQQKKSLVPREIEGIRLFYFQPIETSDVVCKVDEEIVTGGTLKLR